MSTWLKTLPEPGHTTTAYRYHHFHENGLKVSSCGAVRLPDWVKWTKLEETGEKAEHKKCRRCLLALKTWKVPE